MPRIPAVALLLAVVACAGDYTSPPNHGAPPPDKTTAVVFPGGTITAEIAATSTARDTGLMNRASLGASAGMLFVFGLDRLPGPFSLGFWMKNTAIPLSIAFMDSTRRVVSVQDMAPFDTVNIHRSPSAYRYALEVNQGWFAQHGVTAGTTATFTVPPGTIISP